MQNVETIKKKPKCRITKLHKFNKQNFKKGRKLENSKKKKK